MAAHVAILRRPYLRMVLDGRKTVESRLTRTARVPFEAIEPGQRIYFKASSGPYMATAVADAVTFHRDLTPAAVDGLRRRYNDAVCGDAAYWQTKRHSRYATFIGLREVQATSIGPRLAPSRGPAWFVVDEAQAPAVFDIVLSAGALRNRYVRIPRKVHTFAEACYGGRTTDQAGVPIEFVLPDQRIVRSDILGNQMVRWRGWGSLFDRCGLRPGDALRFMQQSPNRYHVVIPSSRNACPAAR